MNEKRKNLTGKQQRFVGEYLVDLNATQAAIRAGYSPKTAKSIGQENLTKPDIQESIQERRKALQAITEITQEKVLNDIETTRKMALEAGNFNAALKASEMQARHVGLFERDNIQGSKTLEDYIMELDEEEVKGV